MTIKIITGFRDDQYYSINDEEAHKAYYLFNNPEARTIFSNGVALIGKNIQGIEPDYNTEMGWKPTHKLDADDWEDIRQKGLDKKMQKVISEAKDMAYLAETKPEVLKLPLSEVTPLYLK